jgi:hypothetical protein
VAVVVAVVVVVVVAAAAVIVVVVMAVVVAVAVVVVLLAMVVVVVVVVMMLVLAMVARLQVRCNVLCSVDFRATHPIPPTDPHLMGWCALTHAAAWTRGDAFGMWLSGCAYSYSYRRRRLAS